MKVLRITGCSDGLMWYAKRVGDIVPYLGVDVDYKGPIYWSRDNGGYKNIVFQCDAEVEEINVVDQGSN
jgi:hypothetical protein